MSQVGLRDVGLKGGEMKVCGGVAVDDEVHRGVAHIADAVEEYDRERR